MRISASVLRALRLRKQTKTAPAMSIASNSSDQSVTETDSPRLSLQEERRWNRLSESMSRFHEWFKEEFNTIYELADGSYTQRGWSLTLYLDSAKRLNSHLTMHHTVEERHIFPMLAKRMPTFANTADGPHINSHKGIHKGLDDLATLVKKYSRDPTSYSPAEMRACLDGFRDVLFTHLDEEVYDLRGENMRKYWTLEEVEQIGV